MVLDITVPDNYGFCVLGSVVFPFFVSTYMGGKVMAARKDFSVAYPNLYATPGYHKQADEFNRVQRGHQSFFETLTGATAMGLIGGLKYPLVSAAGSFLYCIGSVFFLIGYADVSLDVGQARYKKGGPLKWVGFLALLVTCISTIGSMEGWW